VTQILANFHEQLTVFTMFAGNSRALRLMYVHINYSDNMLMIRSLVVSNFEQVNIEKHVYNMSILVYTKCAQKCTYVCKCALALSRYDKFGCESHCILLC
jgi:hypothetical protein